MNIKIEKHAFPYKKPFVITGYTFTTSNTVRVILEEDGFIGRGEALGINSNGDTYETMSEQLEKISGSISGGITSAEIQDLLPLGGARSALDCAYWDLKAKKSGKSIWELLKIKPKPLATVATIGIQSPREMAAEARAYLKYTNLKIKLCADQPIEVLEAIRTARPDAVLIVDVNQGWTFAELQEYIPYAHKLGIKMIEQPLPRGSDEELEGFKSSVPLGADESCRDSSEYEVCSRRYDVINIKLDKCGGLSDALHIVDLANQDSKELMVGNMCGSSLSMAPSYVVAQFCRYIDIDGPLFLKNDIEDGLEYQNGGIVSLPEPKLWG